MHRLAERPDEQFGHPGEDGVADPGSGGRRPGHALGEQTASDEAEDLCRRLIEPLRIVDDAQERLVLGRVGEQ